MPRRRGRMELAVARALRVAPLLPQDVAAVELARQQAQSVDDGDLFHAGRGLLDVLRELGLTPKARTGIVQVAKQEADPLDELRKRREERLA